MKLALRPLLAALVVTLFHWSAAAADAGAALQRNFATPPDETRPTVRWWWFGPALVKPQLEREMKLMREGGFGGFEVQPTYPLALDGQYPGLKNLRFLSPEFFDLLGFTSARARELGLRMDLTLGSGWPYGGPMFTREEAAQSIRDGGTVTVAPGQTTVAPPPLPPRGGRGAPVAGPVIAALLGPVADAAAGADKYLPLALEEGRARLPADLHGATTVRFFVYAQAGLMQVKRPAYGAEGFIVDHYNAEAIGKFIREIAAPEVAACGPNPPYSVFCDSLEISGEGWTPLLLAEFKTRRGYDLTPLLPALFDRDFPRAAEIRADYGRTIAEIFNERFVDTFTQFAHEHQTRFRIQAYGTPPTTLSTYGRADIDEGENYNWKGASGTRWASSASHLLGRSVTSSEALTWLHSPVFMAAPLDIKAEANLQFLNGINQLLWHGWPYTAPGVEYPGWRFYAAAVFNEKNPWWIVMPDVTGYVARCSYLLRQGRPMNDVALYLPEEDAFSNFTPSNLQMIAAGGGGILNRLVGDVIPSIVEAGYNFDFVDDGLLEQRGAVEGNALAFGDVKYRVVILPDVTRIPRATLVKLERFARQGGILIALDKAPSQAPGYRSTTQDHQAIRELSARLFEGATAPGVVTTAEKLPAALRSRLPADVSFTQRQPLLGFVHRQVSGRDIYFIANTSNHPVADTARFRREAADAEWWDPVTGNVTPANVTAPAAGTSSVAVDLPPYGSQFLVFGGGGTSAATAPASHEATLDWSAGWEVSFKNSAPEPDPAPEHFDALVTWTEHPATRFFSGVARYEKTVDVSEDIIRRGGRRLLDFGTGSAANVAGGDQGMRADFQPPVGDAAVVYVNGQRAGSVWCPPYRLDITELLHPGANQLRIEVANRAVNYMADTAHHPPPDYAALNADRTYGGNRFQAQDMSRIQAQPSGLLAGVRLVVK